MVHLTSDSELLWTHGQDTSPGRRVGVCALGASRHTRTAAIGGLAMNQACPQHVTRPTAYNATRQVFGDQSVALRPATSASPGSPLEAQDLRLLHRPAES